MNLMCKWCKEVKPEELFVKRITAEPYSQRNVKCCRQCWSIYQKERYKKPELRAKQLKANALWRKSHPDQMARYAKKLQSERPAQVKARNRVAYNLRRGYWIKRPCEVCMKAESEAHHDSYAEAHWETVRWLCKEHHEKWHQILDPVKRDIVEEELVKVERFRDEAAQAQEQITALRDRHRELHNQANALELSTWNKVIEKAQPMFDEFLRSS